VFLQGGFPQAKGVGCAGNSSKAGADRWRQRIHSPSHSAGVAQQWQVSERGWAVAPPSRTGTSQKSFVPGSVKILPGGVLVERLGCS